MRPHTLNPLASLSKSSKSTPRLHNLPIDIKGSEYLPISVLIDPHSVQTSIPLPRDQILFCYQALLNTIDSMLAKKYSDFDGHTTSHCCHGIALLAWHLVQMVQELDLHDLRQKLEQAIHYLEQHKDPKTPLPCSDRAPKALVNLACLYILRFIKEPNPLKGSRTVTQKLKILAPISVKTCNHICRSLQKLFANWTAISYEFHLKRLNKNVHVSEAPATLWGKYVKSDFIRSDHRGIKYASNLFSNQIVLAYLSQSKAKVALINDIRNPKSHELIDRYIRLFEGDGLGGFIPIQTKDLCSLQINAQDEPIIVLGGCMYSDTTDKNSLSFKMQPWLNKLAQLMLACDVFYPQFFKVNEDLEFDSTPITPQEENLKKVINIYSSFGTHPKNPSLYCATHIHPASLKEVLEITNNKNLRSLPSFSIPQVQLQT